jgi:hypothetical protein
MLAKWVLRLASFALVLACVVGACADVGLFPGVSSLGAMLKGGLTGALAVLLLALPLLPVVQPDGTDRTDLRDRRIGAGLRDTAWLGAALLVVLGAPTAALLGALYGSLGAVVGVLVGITVGYLYSGRPLVGYWLARLLLTRAGVVPAKQLAFLDFAVSRMLMHKVGGGYMFAHRLLFEHFAQVAVDGRAAAEAVLQLPAVDAHTEELLARALADVQGDQSDWAEALRMLTFVGSYLEPARFVPPIMRTIETMKEALPEWPPFDTDHGPASYPERFHAKVENVAKVYWLVVNAGHVELSPRAAVELGELMRKYTYRAGLSTATHEYVWAWDEQAHKAYTAAARSGHPTYAPLAAHRLAQTQNEDVE